LFCDRLQHDGGAAIGLCDVPHVIGHLKSVDPKSELVRAARAIGICFGD
jgi:hypothetical protein